MEKVIKKAIFCMLLWIVLFHELSCDRYLLISEESGTIRNYADWHSGKFCTEEQNKTCQGENEMCEFSLVTNQPECVCVPGYKMIPEDNVNYLCKKTTKCNDGYYDCPKESTECVLDGDDYYCACKSGFQLKPGNARDTNKGACEETTKCNDGNDICPKESTICVVSENDYYCACKSGFQLKPGKAEDTNKGACEAKSGCKELGGDKTCSNNGNFWMCLDDPSVEEKYKCVCKEGYKEDEGHCTGYILAKSGCKELGGDKTCSDKGNFWMCLDDPSVVGKYKCVCKEGYKEDDGYCIETTKCNDGTYTCPRYSTKCVVFEDDYYCECLSGFQLKKGKTPITNKEECEKTTKCNDGTDPCPKYSTECRVFKDDYYCKCLSGFQLRKGKKMVTNKEECERETTTVTPEIKTTALKTCYCGRNSVACYIDKNGYKACKCRYRYAQRNETCSETCRSDEDCLNGGSCKYAEGNHFCHCREHFKGDRCEIDKICESLNETCNTFGAVCVSIEWLGKGFCECPSNKIYNRKYKICDDICKEDSCVHGKCEVVDNCPECRCDEGFEGKRCGRRITRTFDNGGYIFVTGILCAAVIFFIVGTFFLIFIIMRLKKKDIVKQEITNQ